MARKKFVSVDLSTTTECEFDEFNLSKPKGLEDEKKLSIKGGGSSIAGAYFREDYKVLETYSDKQIVYYEEGSFEITVSASLTINKLYDFLVPKNRFVTSVPSYPGASVGGCIAANVHGQNHNKNGCFDNNVISFALYHPDQGVLEVSREKNGELFDLTLGGFGLTGIILEVKLKLIEIRSNVLDITNKSFSTLYEAYEMLEAEYENYDYFHGWCDLSNIKKGEETGFISFGKFSETEGIVKESTQLWSETKQHNKILISVFNTFLIKIIGRVYVILNLYLDNKRKLFYDFTFPSSKKFYYWSFVGEKGVIEMQMIIPKKVVKSYLGELNSILCPLKINVPLCHMKLFKGKRKLINFTGEGFCLAIHFPNDTKSTGAMKQIDELNNKYNCISSLIKDSRLANNEVKVQYGAEYEKFKAAILRFDPKLIFQNNITKKIFG